MIAPSSPPSSPELRPFSLAEILQLKQEIGRCTELQADTLRLIHFLIDQSNQLQQSQTVVFRMMTKRLDVIRGNLRTSACIQSVLRELDDDVRIGIHDGQLNPDTPGFVQNADNTLASGLTVSLWRENAPAADILEGTEAMYSAPSARHSNPQHTTSQPVQPESRQQLSFAG